MNMKAKFVDIYGTRVDIQESRSGFFRIDLEGDAFPPQSDSLGNAIPYCISLRENEARVLQACLNDYFEKED